VSKELEANSTLSHYRIVSKLGAGGMGEVYLAHDTRLDRKVALKVLTPELAATQDRLRRFITEAKAAAGLHHPNIAHIYEIGDVTESAVTFIAMEFIDGQTLRDKLRTTDISVSESIDIATQIASALSVAHHAGIVHRDIKPDNAMLTHDGLVKVLDFGLAKLSERAISVPIDSEAPTRAVNTEPGIVMGTALYMSPEQARGLPVDERTDIFSLGIVIYEMITHHLPFEGSNTNEILSSILSDRDPQPLARYSSEVPVELQRIVSKALRKDKDERYQTIKDMLLDLKSLKQDLEFEKKVERSKPPASEASQAEHVTQLTSPKVSATTAKELNTNQGLSVGRRGIVVVALTVLAAALISWFVLHRASKTSEIDSIAVLPFENLTHDQNVEYLSDGVTESLINSLSQLPNIRVIARNSVFSYKNQSPNLQQVAQKLDVDAVVTGRVLVQGDTIDVRVELTNASNNAQLWGDRYLRKSADIFAVQDEIARQVTDTLRLRLTGGQQEQVTKRYTDNTEAYRLYLQGRYYMNNFVGENLNRAIPYFDQAIALDPRYSLAYAARGEAFFYLGDLSLSMRDARERAKRDSEMALSLDDKLAEARTVLANVKFQYDWDFVGAEREFKQAIALNPNYAVGHHQYAWYLAIVGRERESLDQFKVAQQLDPMNPVLNVDLNLPRMLNREYDECIAGSRKAIDMFPNFFLPHMTLGTALFAKGEQADGIKEFEKARDLENTPHLNGNLAYHYARAGRKDDARKILAELLEQSKVRYVAPYWIGMIYLGLDEKDEAFKWFEKAYQERSWWLMFMKMDPFVDPVRSDPRFKDLINRIGFPSGT
jgi:eukaryotic-like serine/threonine-protein kinase